MLASIKHLQSLRINRSVRLSDNYSVFLANVSVIQAALDSVLDMHVSAPDIAILYDNKAASKVLSFEVL